MRSLKYVSLILLLFLCGSGADFQTRASQPSQQMKQIICPDHEKHFIRESLKTLVVTNLAGKDLIIVDTSRFRLTLYREGKPLKSFPVAIGTPKTPSPIGEWRLMNKGLSWGGGFGARWMGLNVPWGIYGIHGTNKPGSIGNPASHGCIRMFNHDVLKLYDLAKLGTPVHITGDLRGIKFRSEYFNKQSGQDVVALQLALRKAGFDSGPADGRFGPTMEAAVRKMQLFYGFSVDGSVGFAEQQFLGLL